MYNYCAPFYCKHKYNHKLIINYTKVYHKPNVIMIDI